MTPMSSPSLGEALSVIFEDRFADLHVAMPGRIETYYADKQKADVQPLVRRGYRNEEGERVAEELPIVTDVPIVFPGAGAYSITFPLARGDTVLLVFMSCSIDKWLQRGGDVDPLDDRRHTLSDAVAIPGLRDFGHALSADARAGGAVVIAGSDVRIGGASGTQPTLMADSFVSALNTMLTAIGTAVGTIPTGGSSAGGAINTAATAFATAAAAAKTLSARVR